MFFKRRSRASSYINESDNLTRSQSYDAALNQQHDNSLSQHNTPAVAPSHNEPVSPEADNAMYSRPKGPQDAYGSPRGTPNGHNVLPVMDSTPLGATKAEPMPDLLARAFNEAIRPYTDKIEQLENQMADLQNWVEQLEQQRAEVHSWIDKRGLRPDVPPSIAKVMDAPSPASADTLNAQLDRKITIVNFDLHRLQDDLNDSISSAHFASAMLKFLPDIARLSSLPTGPRYAFDLILKLGGNLNSHGGLDAADSEDLAARRDFYGRLDNAMVEVVRRRFEEQEDWMVAREIKRIEKTAAYLRNFGVEPYFPATLDLMRSEVEYQGQQQRNAPPMNGGAGPPVGTPPRY